MIRRRANLALRAVAIGMVLLSSASAQAPPVSPTFTAIVTLTRLNCGTNAPATDVGLRFFDTYAFMGHMVQLTYSCYLGRHYDDCFSWNTDFSAGNTPTAPKLKLVQLLAQLKLAPEQVKFVAINHYHGDHVGQVNLFPKPRYP